MTPSPEQRREALIDAVGRGPAGRGAAGVFLDLFLAYFDENEPAVANAIRYGLSEVGWAEARTDDLRIDYPEGHPKQ